MADALNTTPTVVPIPPEVTKAIDEVLKPHDADFVSPDIWRQYTLEELYWWSHNLFKRAVMRTPGEKKDKDVYDGENYLGMYKSALADYDPGHDPEKHPNVISLTLSLNQLKG